MENEDNLFTLDGLKIESLKAANIDKNTLIEIYQDYLSNQEILKQQAEYFANILHLAKDVNSVKRRVKDPFHLLTKIVRKRREAIEKNQKSPYLNIDVSNYKSIVNDLVGIRAIYLFKENWGLINNFILDNFNVCEKHKIIINHASDDDLRFYPENDTILKNNMGVEYHYALENRDSRYRSTHYIIKGISPHSYSFELQTRSILDEAWGEIDHHIRYPDFEHDEALKRKMSILNGAISGCEELTSNYFNYFNELRAKNEEGRENLLDEEDKVLNKHPMEDEVKITDESWDSFIDVLMNYGTQTRALRSKYILNHKISDVLNAEKNEILFKNYLQNMFLQVERNKKFKKDSKCKPSPTEHSTSPKEYGQMIGKVSKEISKKNDKKK